MRRISRQAAGRMNLVKLRTSMRRARLESLPTLPTTMKGLAKILSARETQNLTLSLDGKDRLYAGKCGSASRRTFSILFASKRMLKMMQNVKIVFSDATFKPCPRNRKVHQVWSICTVRRNHVRALLFLSLISLWKRNVLITECYAVWTPYARLCRLSLLFVWLCVAEELKRMWRYLTK